MTIELVSSGYITKNTLVRICSQCGTTLNKETTGDLQWLQPYCNHCTKHPITYEKYNKLLAFVKKVNDGFCFNQTDEQGLQMLVNYENEAEDLLKEIGENE